MFRTKKDVDKHVRSMLSKLREDEKNLRGYRIYTLYFNIGEYESALEYIKRYIAANDKNPAAYKALGQCYEKLKRPDKQLEAYQRSLELDKKQTDLLIDVCKLLQNNELSDVTPAKARYWYELAESRNIHDSAVLNLKLKFSNASDNVGVQEIILKEIVRRPHDIGLRIRLVYHYLDQNRIDEAFKYVHEHELKSISKFRNSTEWYQTVSQVLDKYREAHIGSIQKNWPYWLLLITVLERQLFLTLSRTPKDSNTIGHNLLEATNLLFELDQSLNKAAATCSFPDTERDLASEFLAHFRGQLCLHSASLLFKRESEQNARDTWHETTKTTLPLLLLAFNCGTVNKNQQWLKTASETTKQLIELWHAQSCFRVSQAGRTLQSCVSSQAAAENAVLANLRKIGMDKYGHWPNQDDLLNEVRSTVADSDWRKKIHRQLFTNKGHLSAGTSSHFLKSNALEQPSYDWPNSNALATLEETAQYAEPSSLAHVVYLTIGRNNNWKDTAIDPESRCILFGNLNFSTSNLMNCSAETLNQLDIDTFVYASTIQAKRNLTAENSMLSNTSTPSESGKPKMLPFTNMANALCTEEQSDWWSAAYKVYNHASGEDLAELRATLQHGIEAIRGVGNPKMDLIILLKLGQLFSKRAQQSTKSIERAFFEDRSEVLFKFALYMLRMQNSSRSTEPYRRLFKYPIGNSYFEIDAEVNNLAEEAITFLAGRYFKKNAYEECIEDLSGIKLPFATYFQAESYRKMTEFSDTPKKNKRIFLDKAREYLKQTLELLDGPNVDKNHPLKSIVDEDIKRLQNETRKLETNQTLTDSFVSANGRSDLDDTNERLDRHIEVVTPVPQGNYDNVERLIRQVIESLAILKDDVNDVRNRVQNIEERLNKESDDIPSVDDDYNYLMNDEPTQNPNDSSMLVNMSRTVNYQSPLPRQPVLNQPQQQQRNPLLQHQSPMAGMNNSFNMNPMYSNFYGQMPFNPYQAAQQPYQSQQPYQAQQLAGNMGPMPPVLPYNDVFNMNMQQQLLAQQLVLGLSNTSTHLPQSPQVQPPVQTAAPLNPGISPVVSSLPVQPATSIAFNSTPTTAAAIQKQWNASFNNQPVEKGPPVNIVITTSDRLPTTDTPTNTMPFSVTIPPQHIKNNPATSMFSVAKANPTITAALQKPAQPSAADLSVKTTASTVTAPSSQEQKSIFGNLSKPLSSTPFSSPLATGSTTSSTPSAFGQPTVSASEKPTTEAPKPFGSFSFTTPNTTKTGSPFANISFGAQPAVPATQAVQPAAAQPENDAANTSREDEVEHYEPQVHFEPVIPLPDLVEVRTGEENETILFEHRAKLLRYVKESKEWKERGIGNIKLMVNKDDPNKVRLLMRREQVLKLCCNQMLAKDTKFNKLPNTETALSWFGQDYSENELQVEMLAIRFKTAELCRQFHDAVLAAQADMTDGATENNQEISSARSSVQASGSTQSDKKPETKGFGDQFKPKAGSWTCDACYTANTAGTLKCAACEAPKDKGASAGGANEQNKPTVPKSTFSFGNFSSTATNGTTPVAAAKPATQGFGDQFKPKAGSWACDACYTTNTGETLYCAACEAPKDDTVPKKESQNAFGFGAAAATAPKPSFSFGNFGAANSAQPTSTSANTFGTPTFNFSFGSATAQQPAAEPVIPAIEKKEFGFVFKSKSPGKPQANASVDGVEDVSDDENVEEEENNTYFTPVIPLPDKVEVRTGEEDEDILYSHRAKLFRFREKEWRERGLGDIKILRHRQSGKLRVVMRREQIQKICLNHALTPEVEYLVKDAKSWQFVVNDFSEGELEVDNFCIRFKTDEIAKDFKQAIDDALSGTSKPLQNGNGNNHNDQPSSASVTENLTAAERQQIVDLQLPNDFFNYKNHEQCTGCRGCNADEFVFSEVKDTNFGQFDDNPLPLVMPAKTEKKNDLSKGLTSSFSFGSAAPQTTGSLFGGNSFKTITPFGGNENKTPTFSFGQSTNTFGNVTASGTLFQSAAATPPQTTTQAQPSIFGQTKFSSPSIFGGNTNGTDSKPSSGFSFKLPSATSITPISDSPNLQNATQTSTPVLDKTNDKPQLNTPIFSSGSTLSFADLAKSSPANTTATPEPFKVSDSLSFASIAKTGDESKNEPSFLSSSVGGGSFADLAKNTSNSFGGFSGTPTPGGFFGLSNRDTFNNLMPVNGSANNSNQKEGGDDEHAAEDPNYDPHYEPIIALPDEIQVSTGEENEEKIFGERAKLFRYDPVNKEWKERGVGEIKILHHPTNNAYRLLLRREQIHKLVLNLAITPDFQMNPMKQSDKAFCWVAQNYAEDQQNGVLESLSVRFKNADLANKFNQTMQNSIAQLRARGDLEPEDD